MTASTKFYKKLVYSLLYHQMRMRVLRKVQICLNKIMKLLKYAKKIFWMLITTVCLHFFKNTFQDSFSFSLMTFCYCSVNINRYLFFYRNFSALFTVDMLMVYCIHGAYIVDHGIFSTYVNCYYDV